MINEIDTKISIPSDLTKVEVALNHSTTFTNNATTTMVVTADSVQPKVVLDMGTLNKIVNVVDPTSQ